MSWKDRRPIGAIFLTRPQINVSSNPRRWNGELSARSTLPMIKEKQLSDYAFKVADNGIQVLKDLVPRE